MSTAGQTMAEDDQSSRLSVRQRLFHSVAHFFHKCRSALRFEVTEGYEDESGFHYGKEPHPNCMNLQQYAEMHDRKLEQTATTVGENPVRTEHAPTSTSSADHDPAGREKFASRTA